MKVEHGFLLRPDHDIHPNGQHFPSEAERFSNAALPGVPHDRVADFARDAQPQPRVVQSILAAVDHQHVIRRIYASGIDALKVSVLAEVAKDSPDKATSIETVIVRTYELPRTAPPTE